MSILYYFHVAGILVGAIGAFTFIPLFHFTARWWKTFVGRHFMAYSFAIALLYLRAIISLISGRISEPDITTFVLTWLVSSVVAWRVVVYIRLERLKHKRS